MMKLCVVNDTFGTGRSGMPYRIQGMAKYLERYFDLQLCCPYFTSSSYQSLPSIPILPKTLANYYLDNSVLLMKRIVKLVKQNEVDVFLFELPFPILKGSSTYLIKIWRRKVFLDFGDWVCSDLSFPSYLNINLGKMLCKYADKVTASTRKMAIYFKTLCCRGDESITYVPNGVDLEEFSLKRKKDFSFFDDDAKVIGYIGTLSKDKGSHNLLNIARKILAENRKRNVRFLVVGDGPYRPELLRELTRNGLRRYFYFVGRVERPDIPLYISMMTLGIAIYPQNIFTRMGTFPLKVIEYMSMAKPVVCTPLPSIKGIITQGKTGFYCDTNQFPERICQILDHVDLCRKMGENGRRLVEKEYDWKSIVNDLIKFWFN